jgi:hypothetical protein
MAQFSFRNDRENDQADQFASTGVSDQTGEIADLNRNKAIPVCKTAIHE